MDVKYVVCLFCKTIFDSRIDTCPECGQIEFRPMTEEEKHGQEVVWYYLRDRFGKPFEAKGCGVFG